MCVCVCVSICVCVCVCEDTGSIIYLIRRIREPFEDGPQVNLGRIGGAK